MKKILAALLVLALVAPAMADVSVTATDLGSQKLQINFTTTGGAVVRGLAVKLTVTGGNLLNAAAYTTPASAFNTFVDYAFDNAGYTVGAGHPIADAAAAGVATFPATVASISAGYLDEDLDATKGEGLASGVVATLQLSGIANNTNATVAIIADTLRGGIVGDNLGTVTVQASQTVAGPAVVTECVKSTAPFYAAWVSAGKPACWCYQKHCRGDADGLKQSSKVGSWPVGTNDLNILTPVWQVQGNIGTGICADFAKDAQSSKVGSWRVGTNDLNLLTANWQVFDASVPVCDNTNFNFWTN